MKILMYSDIHISRTSSILPTSYKDTKYTYRQKMIINTAEWLSQIMINEKPNLIINLGDTFDQHTLTSYDIHTAEQFFATFKDRMKMNNYHIPHFILIGNHEMINEDFNAVSMLNNVEGITVIKDKTNVKFKDCTLAFLPYREYKTITELPEGDFLFSHNDIQGSIIKGKFAMPNGISTNKLSIYKVVFNGHIHKSSMNGNVINVGSTTTHSFADDNDWFPQAYIFDTETMNLQTFINPNCPLFRSYEVNSYDQIDQVIAGLDLSYKYILHITCPFELKETVINKLTEVRDIVIASKLNVKVTIKTDTEQQQIANNINSEVKTNLDVEQSFREFLDVSNLKFPKQLYLDVINN